MIMLLTISIAIMIAIQILPDKIVYFVPNMIIDLCVLIYAFFAELYTSKNPWKATMAMFREWRDGYPSLRADEDDEDAHSLISKRLGFSQFLNSIRSRGGKGRAGKRNDGDSVREILPADREAMKTQIRLYRGFIDQKLNAIHTMDAKDWKTSVNLIKDAYSQLVLSDLGEGSDAQSEGSVGKSGNRQLIGNFNHKLQLSLKKQFGAEENSKENEGDIEKSTNKDRERKEKFSKLGLLGCSAYMQYDLWKYDDDGSTESSQVEDKFYTFRTVNKAYLEKSGMSETIVSERLVLLIAGSMSSFLEKLHAIWHSTNSITLITTPAMGNELYHLFIQGDAARKDNAGENQHVESCLPYHGSVAHVIFYVSQLSLALSHLNEYCSIAYRDCKPENILVNRGTGNIWIRDYALAKLLPPSYGIKTFTMCGTPDYFSPETVQNKGHSFTTDVWCLGILLFELLHEKGSTPFQAPYPMQTYMKINTKGIKGSDAWADGGENLQKAASLISSLCHSKSEKRLVRPETGMIRLHRNSSTTWIHHESDTPCGNVLAEGSSTEGSCTAKTDELKSAIEEWSRSYVYPLNIGSRWKDSWKRFREHPYVVSNFKTLGLDWHKLASGEQTPPYVDEKCKRWAQEFDSDEVKEMICLGNPEDKPPAHPYKTQTFDYEKYFGTVMGGELE